MPRLDAVWARPANFSPPPPSPSLPQCVPYLLTKQTKDVPLIWNGREGGKRWEGPLTCSAWMQNLIKFVSQIFSLNEKHRGDISFTPDIRLVCASAAGDGFSCAVGSSDQISRLVSARHAASLKAQLFCTVWRDLNEETLSTLTLFLNSFLMSKYFYSYSQTGACSLF